MKLIILGAGIAGAMASGYFRSSNPVVFEKMKSPSQRHRAVFRIKNPEVGFLLGCPLKKISVEKSIYLDRKHFKEADISMANSYSLKVSGEIENRSIRFSDAVCNRYLLSEFPYPVNTEFGCEMVGISPGRAIFVREGKELCIDFDCCISTIPLPEMIAVVGGFAKDLAEGMSFDNNYKSVCVLRKKTSHPCTVNQTIYYPARHFRAYRATLEEGNLIIESIEGYSSPEELKEIANSFGLREEDLAQEEERFEQKYGKISSIDETKRKSLLFSLTTKLGVYSLGRFATWRNIRTDDLISDLSKIDKMMNRPSILSAYDLSKEG